MIKPRTIMPLDPLRTLPLGCNWYVLTTSPNKEFHVARWIEDQGWFSLVPLEKRWKLSDPRRGGKRKERTAYMVPFLPRIVVAAFSEQPPWLRILDRQHITGVMGINHTPVQLRKGEPDLLRAISYALVADRPSHSITPKGKALVTTPGPLQGRLVEVGSIQGRKAIISHIFDGHNRQALPFVMEALLDDLEAA